MKRISESHRFSSSAKHIQRLMIDELAEAKSEDIRLKHRGINLRAISFYKRMIEDDAGAKLRQVEPMFLHLAIIGIFDFFVPAESPVKNIA